MVLFLYGTDTYRSREHLKKIIEKFKKDRDPQGYNVVRLDASVAEDAERILEEIVAPPFLAEKRMVVIASLLSSKLKEIREAIFLRIEEGGIPDATILVFWEGVNAVKEKDAQAMFLRLTKEKYAQQFEPFAGARLRQWIAEAVAAQGGRIAMGAVDELAICMPEDSWAREAVVRQLTAYRMDNEIQKNDVALFLEKQDDENIFSLVDAVLAGRLQGAYGMVREQYRQGKEPLYLLAMIVRQARILLEVQDGTTHEKDASSDGLARALGLHPFVVKKSLSLTRQLPPTALKRLYRDLVILDRGIKTGQGDPKILLDVFIARHAMAMKKTA